MIKRKLSSSSELDPSLLGMGCMRLPMKDGATDYAASEPIIDRCLAGGINYFDTAYVYQDGQNEEFLRRALIRRHDRASFYLADKLPPWLLGKGKSKESLFETTLRRLDTEYIDFYLMHSLSAQSWERCKEYRLPEFFEELKAQGKIRKIGFSFHDTPQALRVIVEEGIHWDFAQIQLNYYDWFTGQRADEQYRILEQAGIPVMVMEPVRGGSLARCHPHVEKILADCQPDFTPPDWALTFAAGHPMVQTVLSGMSTLDQLEHNLALFEHMNPLQPSHWEALKQAVAVMESLPTIPCTGCKYCWECPQGIPIAELLGAYNDSIKFNAPWKLRQKLREVPEDSLPGQCLECGACSALCPQHIDIPACLKKVVRQAEETL